MRRKPSAFALLCAFLFVASCGGGGGSGFPTGPFIPWSKFRHDNNNTGVATDNLINNDAVVTLLYRAANPQELTISSPTIGGDDEIFLGTSDGVLSLDEDGIELWRLRECVSGGGVRRLGRVVSSPTIIANDEELLVGTEGSDGTDGGVFHIGEDKDGLPVCLWSFPAPGLPFASRSSPVAITDPNDFALISTFIGTADGHVLALDMNGGRRWTFPPGDAFPGNLSSSPAFSTAGLIVTSPDGRIYSLDESGRQQWAFPLGATLTSETEILPSPATSISVFAVNGRSVVAINVDGTERWRYEAADEIVGSPATGFLTIPRGGGRLTQETLVYTVDRSGTLSAVVNSSGKLARFCSLSDDTCVPSSCPGETTCIEVRRCSDDPLQDCDDDKDCSGDANCIDSGRCEFDMATECTTDTCLDHTDAGLCTREAVVPITTGPPITVTSSPVLSVDSLTVVATTDARICARRIDGSVPGGTCRNDATGELGRSCLPDSCGEGDHCCDDEDTDCPVDGHCRNNPTIACTPDDCPDDETCTTPWLNGCIELPASAGNTTLSSPVIDRNGAILVTTDLGLVKIE